MKHVNKGNKSKSLLDLKMLFPLLDRYNWLHMDPFWPTRTLSLGGKKYGFVIVDDYFRYKWLYFLEHKHESFMVFEIFCIKVQNEKWFCISSIRSEHGIEFENVEFWSFCEKNGIFHNFSSLGTLQQNG